MSASDVFNIVEALVEITQKILEEHGVHLNLNLIIYCFLWLIIITGICVWTYKIINYAAVETPQVPREVLERIANARRRRDVNAQDGDEDCCICLTSFEGRKVAEIIPCGHLLHMKSDEPADPNTNNNNNAAAAAAVAAGGGGDDEENCASLFVDSRQGMLRAAATVCPQCRTPAELFVPCFRRGSDIADLPDSLRRYNARSYNTGAVGARGIFSSIRWAITNWNRLPLRYSVPLFLLVAFVILYAVLPFDLIPDHFGAIGLVDDAGVIALGVLIFFRIAIAALRI